MKKILIIMVGLFVLSCNNAKDKDAAKTVTFSDLVADNLKGNISSIEETPYKTDSSGKVGEMDSCCISVTEYDENGNSAKSVSKDSKGTISNESVLMRHPNGLFKSVSNTKDGKSTGGFETKLGDDGKVNWAAAIDSNGNVEVYYTDITQNEVGEVTAWKQYDKDSVFRMTGESKYDKHKMLESTTKDSVGKVKRTNAAKYNDKGERTEFSNTTYKDDSPTTKVTKYTYESHDDMGNWTQRTEWDDKGKAVKVVKRSYVYRKAEEKK